MKTFSVTDAQSSLGVAVTTGSYVQLTLSQNTTTGSYPIAQEPIVIALDNTGSCSQSIWFNDEQLPANTFYRVQIVTPNYGVVWDQNVPITGASYNLASFVPGSQSGVSSVQVPTLQTNGTANTVQSLLNLQGGNGITITSDTDGDVTIAGATLQTNGTSNAVQSKLNFTAGNTGITLTADSSGDVSLSPIEQKAQVTVTSSQLENLETTPITIVPAQGAGTFIIPVSNFVFVYKPNTTPYTSNNSPTYQIMYDWRGFLPTQGLTGELLLHTGISASNLGLSGINKMYSEAAITTNGTDILSNFVENTAVVLTNIASGNGGTIQGFSLLGNGSTATFTVAVPGYGYAVNDEFGITSLGSTAVTPRFQVTSVNASGGVTGFTPVNYISQGQWYLRNYIKATALNPSVGIGLYINCAAIGGSGGSGITGYTISSGGTGYAVNDTGTITANQPGGGGTTGKYTVSSVSGGVVTGITITSVGSGFYTGSTAATSKTTGSGSGMVLNVTSVGGGYAVNDTGTVGNGAYQVTSVDASGNVTGLSLTTSPTNLSRGVLNTTTSTGIGVGLNFLNYQMNCDVSGGDGTLVVLFDYIVLTP
jgi:hypothetical protein